MPSAIITPITTNDCTDKICVITFPYLRNHRVSAIVLPGNEASCIGLSEKMQDFSLREASFAMTKPSLA